MNSISTQYTTTPSKLEQFPQSIHSSPVSIRSFPRSTFSTSSFFGSPTRSRNRRDSQNILEAKGKAADVAHRIKCSASRPLSSESIPIIIIPRARRSVAPLSCGEPGTPHLLLKGESECALPLPNLFSSSTSSSCSDASSKLSSTCSGLTSESTSSGPYDEVKTPRDATFARAQEAREGEKVSREREISVASEFSISTYYAKADRLEKFPVEPIIELLVPVELYGREPPTPTAATFPDIFWTEMDEETPTSAGDGTPTPTANGTLTPTTSGTSPATDDTHPVVIDSAPPLEHLNEIFVPNGLYGREPPTPTISNFPEIFWTKTDEGTPNPDTDNALALVTDDTSSPIVHNLPPPASDTTPGPAINEASIPATKTPKMRGGKSPKKGGNRSPKKAITKTPERGNSKTPKRAMARTPDEGVSKTPQNKVVKTPKQTVPRTPQKSHSPVLTHKTPDFNLITPKRGTIRPVKFFNENDGRMMPDVLQAEPVHPIPPAPIPLFKLRPQKGLDGSFKSSPHAPLPAATCVGRFPKSRMPVLGSPHTTLAKTGIPAGLDKRRGMPPHTPLNVVPLEGKNAESRMLHAGSAQTERANGKKRPGNQTPWLQSSLRPSPARAVGQKPQSASYGRRGPPSGLCQPVVSAHLLFEEKQIFKLPGEEDDVTRKPVGPVGNLFRKLQIWFDQEGFRDIAPVFNFSHYKFEDDLLYFSTEQIGYPFHYTAGMSPPVLRKVVAPHYEEAYARLQGKDSCDPAGRRDFLSHQASVNLKTLGRYMIEGKEGTGEWIWRLVYEVHDRPTHTGHLIPGERFFFPMMFACTPEILDPNYAREPTLMNSIKKLLRSKKIALPLDAEGRPQGHLRSKSFLGQIRAQSDSAVRLLASPLGFGTSSKSPSPSPQTPQSINSAGLTGDKMSRAQAHFFKLISPDANNRTRSTISVDEAPRRAVRKFKTSENLRPVSTNPFEEPFPEGLTSKFPAGAMQPTVRSRLGSRTRSSVLHQPNTYKAHDKA